MIPRISEVHVRWIIAELIGTLLLTVTIGVTAIGGELYLNLYRSLYSPLLIGLVITVLVYLFGSVSGAHFNPAVTISLWVVRKIKHEQLVIYVVSQIVGAYVGLRLVKLLLGTAPQFSGVTTSAAMLAEAMGAFVLVLAVTSVVIGRVSESLSGLVIGLALVIGISIALIPSGGVLNPAVALSLGAIHFVYLLAPIVGGICGAVLAVVIGGSEEEKAKV
ncbi:MAG: aquaporin [bacterium]